MLLREGDTWRLLRSGADYVLMRGAEARARGVQCEAPLAVGAELARCLSEPVSAASVRAMLEEFGESVPGPQSPWRGLAACGELRERLEQALELGGVAAVRSSRPTFASRGGEGAPDEPSVEPSHAEGLYDPLDLLAIHELHFRVFDVTGVPLGPQYFYTVAGLVGKWPLLPSAPLFNGGADLHGLYLGAGVVRLPNIGERPNDSVPDDVICRPVGGAIPIARTHGRMPLVLETSPVPYFFQLTRRTAIVIEFEQFRVGSAVLLPGAAPDETLLIPGRMPVNGVVALAACRLVARGRPAEQIRITGHGAAGSQERADCVRALLVADREAFVTIANERGDIGDVQRILRFIAHAPQFLWDCDPPALTDVADPGTARAVASFQRRYGREFRREIPVNGVVGPETWGAIFDCYQRMIAPPPAPSPPSLPYIDVVYGKNFVPHIVARDATGNAADYVQMNAYNPTKPIPGDQGWHPTWPGERVWLPPAWDSHVERLIAAGWRASHGASPPPAPEPVPPLVAPGLVGFGCGDHHLRGPFSLAPGRCSTTRAAEVLLFHPGDEPRLICRAGGPSPCPSALCELYDPREYEFTYLQVSDVLWAPGLLRVRVVDDLGQGLGHADVHLHGPSARDDATDDGGDVTFAALVPGTYRLVVDHEGFQTETRQVEVAADAREAPAGGTLRLVGGGSGRGQDVQVPLARAVKLKRVLAFAPVTPSKTGKTIPRGGVINPQGFQALPPSTSKERDLARNPPVALPRGMLDLLLEAETEPPGQKVLWEVVAAPGDAASGTPRIDPITGVNGNKAILKTDHVGAFSVLVRAKGGDAPLVWNVVFVGVRVLPGSRLQLNPGDKYTSGFGSFYGVVVQSGDPTRGVHGIVIDAEVELTGGGTDGDLGVDQIRIQVLQNMIGDTVAARYAERTHEGGLRIFTVRESLSLPAVDTEEQLGTVIPEKHFTTQASTLRVSSQRHRRRRVQFFDTPNTLSFQRKTPDRPAADLRVLDGEMQFAAVIVAVGARAPHSVVAYGSLKWQANVDGGVQEVQKLPSPAYPGDQPEPVRVLDWTPSGVAGTRSDPDFTPIDGGADAAAAGFEIWQPNVMNLVTRAEEP